MSFNLDFDPVLEFASNMFNSLWGIFIIPLGLILAFGILNWIYKMLTERLGHLGG
jgi:hypothetical protein